MKIIVAEALHEPMEALRRALREVRQGGSGYDAVGPAQRVLEVYDRAVGAQITMGAHHCDDQGCSSAVHCCDARGCSEVGYGYTQPGDEEWTGFLCEAHGAALGLFFCYPQERGAILPCFWEGTVPETARAAGRAQR